MILCCPPPAKSSAQWNWKPGGQLLPLGACTAWGVARRLYSEDCTLYTLHCTLYTVHCVLYTVNSALYTVQPTWDPILQSWLSSLHTSYSTISGAGCGGEDVSGAGGGVGKMMLVVVVADLELVKKFTQARFFK